MRRFVSRTLLFLLPIMVAVVAVNYFGDAANLFTRLETKIVGYLMDGHHVVNIVNYDERKLNREIILAMKEAPDMIVVGSSRAMFFSSEHFHNPSFMNHGMSGGSLEDFVAIYQIYKNAGRLPKKVVMGLDPWIFNRNNDQARWKALARDYETFFSRETNKSDWREFLDNIEAPLQLFSPSYFQASLKELKKKIFDPEQAAIAPTPNRENEGFTKRADGSISYELTARRLTAEDAEKSARQYIVGEGYSIENWDKFDDQFVDLFHRFIAELENNRIEITFVFMPYHPTLYDFMITQPKYRLVFEFENYMLKFAAEHQIKVMGSFNPHKFGLVSAHFFDAMHARETGVEAIFGHYRIP